MSSTDQSSERLVFHPFVECLLFAGPLQMEKMAIITSQAPGIWSRRPCSWYSCYVCAFVKSACCSPSQALHSCCSFCLERPLCDLPSNYPFSHRSLLYFWASSSQRPPRFFQFTGGKHKACGPNLALHLVLSGLAPCFYPATALSSHLTVKE